MTALMEHQSKISIITYIWGSPT